MDPVPSIADAGSVRARTSPVPRQPAGTAAPTATVSVIVPTFNEAGTIARCLESLGWCDEILVVDSHSTDATREIAGGFDRGQHLVGRIAGTCRRGVHRSCHGKPAQ